MSIKPYVYPDKLDEADKVSEPVASYSSQPCRLDVLKHQVMEAVASTDDKITLILCLDMLKNKHKHHRPHGGKSDEELAVALSTTPTDWDDVEHADLSQIDYNKYKPYQSSKTQKLIEKWL